MMRIIRAKDCRTTPWKNGGGATTEIAIGPDGASLDAFDWRVSMARVATDGPFSDFPGIDRTLAVVDGSGMVLTVGCEAPVTLARGSEPISFAGDVQTSARLTNGAITDLNVMTRRGRFSHCLRRVSASTVYDVGASEVAIVLSLHGKTVVTVDGQCETLEHGDAVIVSALASVEIKVQPITTDCYLIGVVRRRD